MLSKLDEQSEQILKWDRRIPLRPVAAEENGGRLGRPALAGGLIDPLPDRAALTMLNLHMEVLRATENVAAALTSGLKIPSGSGPAVSAQKVDDLALGTVAFGPWDRSERFAALEVAHAACFCA